MTKNTPAKIKDNTLRAVFFERPDTIPVTFSINASCWWYYPHDVLFDLMQAHPLLFPDMQRQKQKVAALMRSDVHENQTYTDDWGCVWEMSMPGMTGVIVDHPLCDWTRFDKYVSPDPQICSGRGKVDRSAEFQSIQESKKSGELVRGELVHGHTFLLLSYLRGYENLLFDMADQQEKLPDLIEMVEDFNTAVVCHYLKAGVDIMSYPEDLGMQYGPMLSPDHFRQYIYPSYRRLMRLAKQNGTIIHMHSDGDVRALADHMIEGGVQVLNIQDLVNGIDWIKENYKGKVCIELDVDRQKITPFGTREQIHALIKEEVEILGDKQGGLMMIYGLYPGVPIENIEAVMDAMETYACAYS